MEDLDFEIDFGLPPLEREPLEPEELQTMDELFRKLLPESLYLNHYELHDEFPDYSVEDWRRYLKDSDKFILKETAILTEVNARKGLKNLASGDLKQGEATALKQLLDRSEQINTQVKDKTAFVTLMLPDHNKDNEIIRLKQEIEDIKQQANARMIAMHERHQEELAKLRGETDELSE
ncbi:MAG: hypothetical protein ABS939_02410 [Psychrobacillus sp.]